MSETRVHEARMRALKAKKACPDGIRSDPLFGFPDKDVDMRGKRHLQDCLCDGSGRVPVLDAENKWGLRVGCPHFEWVDGLSHEEQTSRVTGEKIEHCPMCQGLGYTPSDDFWAWLDALEDLNSDETVVRIDSLMYNVLAYQERELAFYTAIVEAVTA